MRDEVIRLVETYIEAVRTNNHEALPLHPDIVFESPLNTIRGIDAFRTSLTPFVKILKGVKVVRLVADDQFCAAALELDTIFGLIPFLEFFQIVDGEIVSIRAYYDPRTIIEGMSRTAVQ
jgi:limonene-1,2-epoxide hydrolase